MNKNFNLWLLYKFTGEHLVIITSLGKSPISLNEKIHLISNYYPSWIIRALASRFKDKSLLKKKHYNIFPLPWSSIDLWDELLKLFKIQPHIYEKNILFQLLLLTLWSNIINTYISLPSSNTLKYALLLSIIASTITYCKNLLDVLYLCKLYRWHKQTPPPYSWAKNIKIPTTLNTSDFDTWNTLEKMNFSDQEKNEHLIWTLKLQKKLLMIKRNRLTYLIIFAIFFSCIVNIGQEFFEHLYSKNSFI